MIELRNVTKRYLIGNKEVMALGGIDLSIKEGEFVTLKGPSGSGKSTLLNIIGLVDTATTGEYLFQGKPVQSGTIRERSRLRAQFLGFVFQNYNLIPELSIYENVEIPLIISNEKMHNRKELITSILNAVGLGEYIKRKPGELSGGQQQRVAVARALVKKPPLVIADEPTANLDSRTGREIVQLMKKLNKELGVTFIFATHDETILEFIDRIVHIRDGLIEKS